MFIIEKNSPFTPGSPVPIELFVGRRKQIDEILRYLKQTAHGKQEHIFLVGERGIGKSSLASFLKYITAVNEEFLSVYLSLGGVHDVEELIRRVIEKILIEIKKESDLKQKFSSFIKKQSQYIQEVGLFGISIRFNPPGEELKHITRNFPDTLKDIWKRIQDKKRGILLIFDDINGLSRNERFANWYKSFVDTVAIRYPGNFPVALLVIGLPEVRDTLTTSQPSLMRVFRVISIEKLEDAEVEDFFIRAFEKVEMHVDEDAMKIMVEYSSGLPILMHEIGDAVFWQTKDERIGYFDAFSGILEAADRIGKKYLDPKVYRAIRSERYRSILRKLGKQPFMTVFKKKEIESQLNENEKKVFNNFLRRMRDLGVITQELESGRGTYKFVNMLYPVYIWMESQRFRERSKGHS